MCDFHRFLPKKIRGVLRLIIGWGFPLCVHRASAVQQSVSSLTLAQLVDWAERTLMDGGLDEAEANTLSSVIARLGIADGRTFGLAWDDCEELLGKLGFLPRIEVVAR